MKWGFEEETRRPLWVIAHEICIDAARLLIGVTLQTAAAIKRSSANIVSTSRRFWSLLTTRSLQMFEVDNFYLLDREWKTAFPDRQRSSRVPDADEDVGVSLALLAHTRVILVRLAFFAIAVGEPLIAAYGEIDHILISPNWQWERYADGFLVLLALTTYLARILTFSHVGSLTGRAYHHERLKMTLIFSLDLTAALPWDYICLKTHLLAVVASGHENQVLVLRGLRLITLLRLLILNRLQSSAQATLGLGRLSVVLQIGAIAISIHWGACLWFLIQRVSSAIAGDSAVTYWVDYPPANWTTAYSPAHQYFWSLLRILQLLLPMYYEPFVSYTPLNIMFTVVGLYLWVIMLARLSLRITAFQSLAVDNAFLAQCVLMQR